MAKIIFTHSYTKKEENFFKRQPHLLKRYKKTLELLEINPFHPALKLHKLKGKLSDVYSVSINLKYRITLYFVIEEETIIPIDIGSHDQVY